MCKELKLIIEVDGSTHDFTESEEADSQRQHHLETLGFSVLRFSDQSVTECLPDVAESLYTWILAFEANYGSSTGREAKEEQGTIIHVFTQPFANKNGIIPLRMSLFPFSRVLRSMLIFLFNK